MAPIRFWIDLLNTGERLPITIHDTATLGNLKEVLVDSGREIDDRTLKVLHHGRTLPTHSSPGSCLRDVGIRHGSKLKAMWSGKRDVERIQRGQESPSISNRKDWVAFPGQDGAGTGNKMRGEPGHEAEGRQPRTIDPGLSSHPIPQTPPEKKKEDSSATFKKGDAVLYRTRDGNWQKVTIASVDHSLIPPSYGIHVVGADGSVNYRETEESRLKAISETDTSEA